MTAIKPSTGPVFWPPARTLGAGLGLTGGGFGGLLEEERLGITILFFFVLFVYRWTVLCCDPV